MSENPATEFLLVEPNISELPPSLSALSNATLGSMEEAVGEAEVLVLLVNHAEFAGAELVFSRKRVVDTLGTWS